MSLGVDNTFTMGIFLKKKIHLRSCGWRLFQACNVTDVLRNTILHVMYVPLLSRLYESNPASTKNMKTICQELDDIHNM